MRCFSSLLLTALFAFPVHAAANRSAIPAQDDYIGSISIENWDGTNVPSGKVSVESGSAATVTVSGLPKGLTYNKSSGELVAGESKMPDGNHAFVISAQNANKYRNDQVFSFVTEAHDTSKDPWDWGERYTIGQSCRIYCTNFVSSADTLTMKGLPSGLKLVRTVDADNLPTYWLEGTPTKVGRSTVTWTVKHAQASYSIQYYMVVNGAPSKYIEAVDDDLPTGCKVTGSGVYDAGKKATLKATAAKGMVFAGWYADAALTLPAETGADYRNPTLAITDVAGAETAYYPRFIALREDSCGEITVPEPNEYGVPEGVIAVASESLPTITVSGLPAGLTFDKKTNALVFNAAKMKDGDYAFVVSVKNAGGYRNDLVVAFQYGDPEDVPESWSSDYAVGQIVGEALGFEPWTTKDSLKLTGLPTGLKLVTSYEIDDYGDKWPVYTLEGVPTKPGRSTVTWTETRYDEDGKVLKGDDAPDPVKYHLTVQGAPSRYVEVVVGEGSPTGCKATGSGVYAAGATVKTSATAAKNCVFAGWYEETNAFDNVYADFLGKDGDCRIASQTWLCGTDGRDGDAVATVPDVLVARFVPKADDALGDDAIAVVSTDELSPIFGDDISVTEGLEGVWGGWNVRMPGRADLAEQTMGVAVSVDSVSAPKLTVKGAPSGLTVKNYGTWAELSYDPTGKSEPKPGEYAMTLTAVNQSKASVSRIVTVRIPNRQALVGDLNILENLDGGVDGHFAMTVGESMADVFDVGELTTESLKTDADKLSENGIAITSIAVSGLPSGVSCKNGVFSGTPSKAGVYAMTVTVAYTVSGGKVQKTTATAFFRVEGIDTTCVGTFNGAAYGYEVTETGEGAVTNAVPTGTISATVSAAGKLTSCKLVDLKGKSTSIALKTQSFFAEAGYYEIVGTDGDGAEYAFDLYPAEDPEDGTTALGGALVADLPGSAREEARRTGEAQQNVWGDKALKAAGMIPNFPAKGVTVRWPQDDPELTLLFKAGGAVTVTRGRKSGSARFELVTFGEDAGWTGLMTVNVPDGTAEGYCNVFDVSVSSGLEVAVSEAGGSNE